MIRMLCRVRADKVNAAVLAYLGKIGIFRQKAVAGMNRLGIGQFGGTDDGIDIEIAQQDSAAGPIQTLSSASLTCSESLSAVE